MFDDADGLSVTQCVTEASVWRRLSCPQNDLLHIHRAFLAVANNTDSQFCQQPMSDADAHCVISDVTADVIAACATFTNCRMSASNFERFPRNNCTGQSRWSQLAQRIYLHVGYLVNLYRCEWILCFSLLCVLLSVILTVADRLLDRIEYRFLWELRTAY